MYQIEIKERKNELELIIEVFIILEGKTSKEKNRGFKSKLILSISLSKKLLSCVKLGLLGLVVKNNKRIVK